MFRLAALIWIILGTVLAGIALMVIVTVPQLNADAPKLIPIACVSAFAIAMLLSMVVAKRITGPSRPVRG
jgi:hypothetical protein